MAYDFSVEPEYQAKLDWALEFVQDEIYPLEVLGLSEEQIVQAVKRAIVESAPLVVP